jgi:hypothetical protein
MTPSNTFSHPELGVVRYSVQPVPDSGDGQTAAVINLMAIYAIEDSASPEVQQAVAEAQAEFPNLSPEEQVFRYVKRHVRFTYDEQTALPLQTWYEDPIVETLVRPRDMLALGPFAQGDCDDFSMLVASMLLAQGIDVAYVTVAVDPADPSQYSHVYVAAYRDGHRIPIDASHGPHAGWETPEYYRRTEWPFGQLGIKKKLTAGLLILGAFLLLLQKPEKKKEEQT